MDARGAWGSRAERVPLAIATGTDPLNLIWVMPAEGGAVRRLAI